MEPYGQWQGYAPEWTRPDGTEASVKRRMAGYVIDVHGVSALAKVPALCGGGLLVVHDSGGPVTLAAVALIVLGFAISLAVAVTQMALLGSRGSTIGQRMAGYALARQSTGWPGGFWTAVGYRVLMYLVSAIASIIGPIVMAVLASKEPRRRTLVDQALELQSRVERADVAFVRRAVIMAVIGTGLGFAAIGLPLWYAATHVW